MWITIEQTTFDIVMQIVISVIPIIAFALLVIMTIINLINTIRNGIK